MQDAAGLLLESKMFYVPFLLTRQTESDNLNSRLTHQSENEGKLSEPDKIIAIEEGHLQQQKSGNPTKSRDREEREIVKRERNTKAEERERRARQMREDNERRRIEIERAREQIAFTGKIMPK